MNRLHKLFLKVTLSLLSCIISWNAQAHVIKNPIHFDHVGAMYSFQWAPARYESDFKYDIFYYIPTQLANRSQVPALIFNHGGGQSTLTREGSIRAVTIYLQDLKRLADELGMIVILPSANGLNWGGHTRGFMRNLAQMIRTELDVDPNQIGLSGHSMGGMGITREYAWIADEFAYFLPMSAGMDENMQNERYLSKVFNVPYTHLQGLADHFDIFISRTKAQVKNTQALEQKYQRQSKFKAIFYQGDHSFNYPISKAALMNLYQNPRNLYQPELWGTIHTVHSKNPDNNIIYDYESEARYFWLEFTQSDLTQSEATDFFAAIHGQTIDITMPVLPKASKAFKVYLSSKLINLQLPISITLNGVTVANRPASAEALPLKNFDSLDPGFNFEDVMEIQF